MLVVCRPKRKKKKDLSLNVEPYLWSGVSIKDFPYEYKKKQMVIALLLF